MQLTEKMDVRRVIEVTHRICHSEERSDDVGMPARALTNDTYDSSLSFLREHERSGARELPPGPGSLERFFRAATLVRAAERASKALRSTRRSGFSSRTNRALIEKAHRGVDFLRDTPASELDAAAAHPDTTSCVR